MKLAMAMTACNRPEYLNHVLVSLANNKNLDQYTLNFGVEPGNAEVAAICGSVKWMNSVSVVNPVRFGVRKNPYEMLKRVFDSGADGVLYLEDDVELATDAVALANWYWALPNNNDYLCLNLYNHDSVATNDPDTVIVSDKFSALGIGITKHQWYSWFEPSWWKDPRGWDFCFTELIAKGLKTLQPKQSRSHHIGRFGGVHYRANMHDHLYVHNHMYVGPGIENFRIE